jgi:hypothetical protein
MHARMTIVPADPEQLDALLSVMRDRVLPQARGWEGFKGLITLADRSTGKNATLTLFETEEAMRANDESANQLRSDVLENIGVTRAPTVERYEVAIFEA